MSTEDTSTEDTSTGDDGPPDHMIEQAGAFAGQALARLDGPLKAQGMAPFAAEFVLDGMLYAALAFSTIAKGRLATLDTGPAEASAGVALVMTPRNAPRMQPMPLLETSEIAAGTDDFPIMQDDRIHWNGQPIAVVLAQTQEEADFAASLIAATYATEPATTVFTDAKAHGTEHVQSHGAELVTIGDAEGALAAAAVSVDSIYRTPRQNQNAIEPHAVTVTWERNVLVVHDASQSVTQTARSLAQIFGIDSSQVRVTSPFVGGGFGGKLLSQHHVLAAAAARLASRPVRLSLSREGVYRVVGGRAMTEQRVAIGADVHGRFEAIIHTGTVGTTRHSAQPEPFLLTAQSNYRAGSFKLDLQAAFLDIVPNCLMRGPGTAVGSFAFESAVDELAVALDTDPIELRIRNEPESDPVNGRLNRL